METLWGIARARYTGQPPKVFHLWRTPPYGAVADELGEDEDYRVVLDTMHMELAYYVDPSAPTAPAEPTASTR